MSEVNELLMKKDQQKLSTPPRISPLWIIIIGVLIQLQQ